MSRMGIQRRAHSTRANGPAAPGSKAVPQGKPNCLAGLTFVFTGELQSLSREDAQDLARRYGAKVTTGPSSKTSYVVLGEGAGPSKLKAIEKNGLKTLDEDGFLGLIADRGEGEPDKAAIKKQEAEQQKILAAAAELRKEVKKSSGGAPGAAIKGPKEHALWTSRYAPARMKDLVGNGTSIAKIEDWLTNWQASYKADFKKPGKNAIGVFRALLLSGPPGVGKTSAAHLLARKCGYTPMELNASDARSKKLIEASLKDTINNSSLDSWYNGTDKPTSADGVRVTDRTCLIMDEVDGMSGGDRGGVGAINALIRKTKVPILCICNEAKTPKMRPLESTCGQIKFARPDSRQIRSRLLTIAFSEKMKVAPEVMDELIRSAQNDIRLVINMLSTWALSSRTMDFDEGKDLGAANVKPGMHTPFSLYNQVSGQGFFSPTNPANLTQKSEVYFSDHSIMPLMVQTNYINQAPTVASRITNHSEKEWKTMELMTKAAISISDGEVIDAMIHSPQQHWSLMPHHAIASVIRPMSFVYGQSAAKNKMYGPSFPTWLGINSKAQRLSRVAVEIQTKMRLAASGSRFEVREQYLPYFVPRLTQPLVKKGQGGIEEVIEFMDDYYLNPEDREGILELGIGENNMDAVVKPIKTDVKSAFTRRYNSTDHPIAFYKGQNIAKAKKLVGEPAPDVEELEGAEVSDVSDNEMEEVSDNEDLSKNKMIKEKKPKGKGKSGKGK
ncbi:DNA replication factor C, large subunit [Ceraceosorus guamensis]|uniref:Replication factor C subunit 1 n=1 Tax=Ceraceosorus guamensis TaxID=1522189 RepID=A0A316WDS0_9BASI|nr:DNA replication factor C, large subunit [Ceraceosorus guamensis]PWN45963.1 DNA replication factor C, large subunit [Ceraceosorus guamensis]